MNENSHFKRVALVVNALSGSELKAGKSDSGRVFQVLCDPALGACDPGSATLVRDCPDRNTFNRTLLTLLDGWESGDQLLLYFSGHGEERKGLYHLCFGAEKKSYFPFKNILTELVSAGVSRAIVILDSCQSGAALRKGEKRMPHSPVVSADEIPRGLAIVTSCRANENSHEKDDRSQSVFTEVFCDAITSGLSGSPTLDGKISVSDLVSWVNKTLQSDPKLAGFAQTSTYGIDNAEHPVWIALNKSGRIGAEDHSKNEAYYSSARPETDFDNWLTNANGFSVEVVKNYREKLRPDVRESTLADSMDDLSFLAKANLFSVGRLYATGVLLFSEQPEKLIPGAYVQCFEFAGTDRSAPQDQKEIYGPLIRQLEGAMNFIENRIEKVEITEQGALAATFEYQYPMVCIREVLANALCHRDYLDGARHTHVRVFQDRIEIVSPGLWGSKVIEDSKEMDLDLLESESATRNERLATALRRIRLVETGGSGIPSALSDCKERGAKPPTAFSRDRTVKVTIYPRANWSKSSFGRRGMQEVSQQKRFRVAFSFSGENRDFVAQVAAILANRFGESAILYDKFHQAELARPDLDSYLPTLYNENSELSVVMVSRNVEEKQWIGLKWDSINAIVKDRRDHAAMLTRFDRALIPDLSATAGYLELNERTPEQVAALILERLALNEGKPKDYYVNDLPPAPRPTRTTTPNNLPRLQPFFGREEELHKIADTLNPASRTWGALIEGPGGMGKTSLAVRAAYDTSAEVFEKIAFVSLKGRELDDDGERDLSGFLISGLAELLNELARELGHADIAKAPESQRPRMLLEVLRGTRTLLVLDNLESLLKRERDTIFTFVKKLPSGCKAILTSRGRIGSGAEELILEKLSESAALDTLAKLSESNPALAKTSEEERRLLYRETGGIPLLLRWTAGQIGRGNCTTLADAIFYLRACPEGNDPLEFIFGDLVEDFTETETSVLGALTYFTLPAKQEHITQIAACSEADTHRALRSLVNRSLVIPSDELKTSALVPLIADFLRKKKPNVLAEIGDRLEKRAYALIVQNGYQNYDRFPVLDEAWPTVAPALPMFINGSNERLQTACDALKVFLDFTGRWDELLSLSHQAEARAASSGNHHKAGWRAYEAAITLYRRQQAEEVLAYADRAAAYWQHSDAGAPEHYSAIRLRGIGYELSKDFSSAIAAFREVLDLLHTFSPESPDIAISLNDLAEVEHASGDLTAAERHFREALRLAQEIDDVDVEADVTGNLADLMLHREDWANAEALARDALAMSEKVGRQDSIASNCHHLALALIRQENCAAALRYAQRAVDIYARLNSPKIEAARKTLEECEE